ncbi:MAG TPA: S1/P1 nuclease [Fimbriimonadaceae bacterium]|nr:S1/P1 nuclease [Fimbriimonadaceae bacterium]
MNRFLRTATALGVFALAVSGYCWDDTGHMVIAAIAEDRLSQHAYDECTKLLAVGGTDKTKGFVAAACWADDTKNKTTGPWHYIDIPFRTDGKPTQTKPAEENVVWAINHFSDILKDKTKPEADRADALRYLIHFVGDVHQPLHAVTMESDEHPNGDRGGNDFPIKTDDLFTSMQNPPTNLHSLWDMGAGLFVPHFVSRPLNPESLAKIHILGQDLVAKFPTTVFKGEMLNDLNPKDWADESNATAQNIVYKVRTGGEIDLLYVTTAKTIAGGRAALAGYRLAALLNKLLP